MSSPGAAQAGGPGLALSLFLKKGYPATTMENIVETVSLSKGGLYRIYPSTAAIPEDLILSGMRLRNAYYESRVEASLASGSAPDQPFLVDMIGDSLLLYPEYSRIYVEFLWEKQRSPLLQALFDHICAVTEARVLTLIRRYGAQDLAQEIGGTVLSEEPYYAPRKRV